MNPASSAKTSTSSALTISRTMRVSDILTLLPNATPQLAEYGLSCFSCAANEFETLEEGCRSHGFSDQVIDDLVTDLNILFAEGPARPQTLTITEAAASALQEMLAAEGKAGWMLHVTLDAGGGFCMEFAEKAQSTDLSFMNEQVPTLKVIASPLTLAGIGGSTIDLRDGRFKLDLPDSLAGLPEEAKKKGCACKNGGSCDCGNGGCGC